MNAPDQQRRASTPGADLLDGDLDLIRLELETHYFGTLSMIRAFAPVIAGNGGGAILNVLSVLSWFGFPATGAYSAAKSAEWAMTNVLRVQLADQGVRVAGLHVGYMDTDMAAGRHRARSPTRRRSPASAWTASRPTRTRSSPTTSAARCRPGWPAASPRSTRSSPDP